MSTRRDFLFSSLVVAAMPVLANGARVCGDTVARVITESGCADTRSFAQAFDANAMPSGADPADVLFHLDDELATGKVDVVYGLTRSSTRFLVEQTATPYGYRLVYHGEHCYTPEGLQHSLNAAPGLLPPLMERFRNNSGAWTGELAQAMRSLGESTGMTTTRKALVAATAPGDSPRHLVSWLLRQA